MSDRRVQAGEEGGDSADGATLGTAAGAPDPGSPIQFPCAQCGAKLLWEPGAEALKCEHCGHANAAPAIEADKRAEATTEIDLLATLESLASRADQVDAIVCHCASCGADVTMKANITSQACAFCGTPVVAQGLSKKLIKPRAMLPFKVARQQASDAFSTWLSGLWFAPGDLKKMAAVDGRLQGIYMPYWTYDSKADTTYTGQRGDDYWDTETYWSTVNGKRTMQTRRVRKTRWRFVTGRVHDRFDDVLVPGSSSLPSERLAGLGSWDLPALVPFDPAYLSGFEAESYTIDLKAGFDNARPIMVAGIRGTICRDIGGDHQRITTMSPRFFDMTFKHILVPVWIAAYRYNGNAYRFLVNGRTGTVTGDRPYSASKIALAVIAGLLAVSVIALVIAMMNR